MSGFNILTWALSATALGRRRASLSPEFYSARRLQLLLSAGYVFGCAFRSALPVFDVPRIVLFDTWLSSIVVGRSVATFAELCFAAQWALLLREISQATGSGVGRVTARVMVPLIMIAETFSWYSVLTTSNIGHVVEESLWGLTAGLLVLSLAAIWPRCDTRLRALLGVICAAGLAYIVFMFLVDVPMYWSRWMEDQAAGRHQLDLAQGLFDVSERRVVSHHWDDWKNEIAWMSLYFSVAVWLSIALVHAPVLTPRTAIRRVLQGAGR
ncbi:MAG: hypothetical protein WCR74_15010 [Betaproteobacteria bacterium]